MRQSGNESTRVGSLVRREWVFSMPATPRQHSSGATLVVAFLAALIGVAVLLAVFARMLLTHYEAQAPAAAQPRVAVLNQEAELLQKKVVDLVSGSIEAKLQAIESSIQQGRVTAADLQTLDELRQELRILANYGANSQAVAADPMLIRSGIPAAAPERRGDGAGVDELSFVKGLFYFSIVSVGVASLLAGSYWMYQVRRQRRLPSAAALNRPVIGARR